MTNTTAKRNNHHPLIHLEELGQSHSLKRTPVKRPFFQQGIKGCQQPRAEQDARQPRRHGIQITVADSTGNGAGAVTEQGKTETENQSANRVFAPGTGLGTQLNQAKSVQDVQTDHARNDGGKHDLQDREIDKQELSDNDIVLGNAAFMQKEAKKDTEQQSPAQLHVLALHAHHPLPYLR